MLTGSLVAHLAITSASADPVIRSTGQTVSVVEPPVFDFPVPNLMIDEQGDPIPYIVNGDDVVAEDFRDVVYLSITDDTGAGGACTGTLISPNWILTAAHCTDGATPPPEGGGGNVRVSFGNNTGDGVFDAREADNWLEHPTWAGEEALANGGDVALVHLTTPMTAVQPTALNQAPMDDSWIGLDIEIVGFGITRFGGAGGGVKRQAASKIFSFDDFTVFDFDGIHSTCQGDSGGPSFLQVGAGTVQISVTSYGPECGAGPSGSMRVDFYLDWIKENILPDTVTTTASAPPSFQCNRELEPGESTTYAIGVAPMELRCVIDYFAPEEITKVTWEWGDGDIEEVATAPFTTAKHTYLETGSSTLRVCVDGVREAGPWQHCLKRFGYVRTCGVPDVAFEAEQGDGLAVQFSNRTDVSDFGCISDISWQVYEGDATSGTPIREISAWEPQVTFDTPGTYTAVLNVGGIGGTGAAKLAFDVKSGGLGCDSTGLGGIGAVGVLAALGLVRRRRG